MMISLKTHSPTLQRTPRSTIMMSKISMTFTGLQLALAGASAYVVCTTDLLRGASLFIH